MKNNLNTERLISCFLYLFWPIAILSKKNQFIVLALITLFLIIISRKVIIDKFMILIFCYLIVYFISGMRRICMDDIEDTRIMAFINSLLIWIIALCLYQLFRNCDIDLRVIFRSCYVNICIMILLSIVTIICFIFSNQIIVRNGFTNSILYVAEYSNIIHGNVPRMCAFLDYPTLVIGVVLLFFPMGVIYIYLSSKRFRLFKMYIFCLATCIPVLLSRSRSGYCLYIAMLFVWIMLLYINNIRYNQRKRVAFTLFISVIVLACIMYPYIYALIQKLLSIRKGSQDVRFAIYEETWKKFVEYPLIGFGVKIKALSGYLSLYPLGSHCTYLGFLFKSGIVGTIFVITAFYSKIKEIFIKVGKTRNSWFTILFYGIIIMMFFFIWEDMDGSNWQLCIWLSMLGILSNKKLKKDNSNITRF